MRRTYLIVLPILLFLIGGAVNAIPVETAIEGGVNWLFENQNPDGSWGKEIDLLSTAFSINALEKLGYNVTEDKRILLANNYTDLKDLSLVYLATGDGDLKNLLLSSQDINGSWVDVSTTSVVLIALSESGYSGAEVDNAIQFLEESQNGDGSWGEASGYTKETALAAYALMKSGVENNSTKKAIHWLASHQRVDGSWTYTTDTAFALLALNRSENFTNETKMAVDFLNNVQNLDGGRGIRGGQDSMIYPSAISVLALAGYDPTLEGVSGGVDYILSSRNPSGGWGTDEFSGTIRETTVVIDAFKVINESISNTTINWVEDYNTQNNDELSRKILALLYHDKDINSYPGLLINGSHYSGGWGIDEDYAADVWDTNLALISLSEIRKGYPIPTVEEDSGVYYLLRQLENQGMENDDFLTALTISTLIKSGVPPTDLRIVNATKRLMERNITEPIALSSTILAVMKVEYDPGYIDEKLQYIINQQESDGSWKNDIYTTALVLSALGEYKRVKGINTQIPLSTNATEYAAYFDVLTSVNLTSDQEINGTLTVWLEGTMISKQYLVELRPSNLSLLNITLNTGAISPGNYSLKAILRDMDNFVLNESSVSVTVISTKKVEITNLRINPPFLDVNMTADVILDITSKSNVDLDGSLINLKINSQNSTVVEWNKSFPLYIIDTYLDENIGNFSTSGFELGNYTIEVSFLSNETRIGYASRKFKVGDYIEITKTATPRVLSLGNSTVQVDIGLTGYESEVGTGNGTPIVSFPLAVGLKFTMSYYKPKTRQTPNYYFYGNIKNVENEGDTVHEGWKFSVGGISATRKIISFNTSRIFHPYFPYQCWFWWCWGVNEVVPYTAEFISPLVYDELRANGSSTVEYAKGNPEIFSVTGVDYYETVVNGEQVRIKMVKTEAPSGRGLYIQDRRDGTIVLRTIGTTAKVETDKIDLPADLVEKEKEGRNIGLDVVVEEYTPLFPDLFEPIPASVISYGGYNLITWNFSSLTGNETVNITYTANLTDLIPGQNILISNRTVLTYTDPDSGLSWSKELGPIYARTEKAIINLAIDSDKQNYSSYENVSIILNTSNTGELMQNLSYEVLIRDYEKNIVTNLSTFEVNDLSPGESRVFNFTWNTGATPAGGYNIYARVYGDGQILAENSLSFNILPVLNLTSSISTDKTSYSSNEYVEITSDVKSESPNYVFEDLIVNILVADANGTSVYTAQKTIPLLYQMSSAVQKFYWYTASTPPGNYTVILEVYHNSTLMSTDNTTITIIPSFETMTGLEGTLEVIPSEIRGIDDVNFSYLTINRGNTALDNISLMVSLVSPSSQEMVLNFSVNASLDIGENISGIFTAESLILPNEDYLVLFYGVYNTTTIPIDTAYLRVLATPRTLKNDSIFLLLGINASEEYAQEEIAMAVEHVNKSLASVYEMHGMHGGEEVPLWLDDYHIDEVYGYTVFDEEKMAVKHLLRACSEDVTHGMTCGDMDGMHNDDVFVLTCPFNATIIDVINNLLLADELLVNTSIKDAELALANATDPEEVQYEIDLAYEELDNAYAAIAADRYAKAIYYFKEAWGHAQQAIEYAKGGSP